MKPTQYEECLWADVKAEVQALDPLLFQSIETFGPTSQHTLCKARYPYGVEILKNGVFESAGTFPYTLVLKRHLEVYLSYQNICIPAFGTVKPGTLLKVPDEPQALWNWSSGARSLFTLPKISENGGFGKLQKSFALAAPKPANLSDHWAVFREIANQKETGSQWTSEVLFFSKAWSEWTPPNIWQPALWARNQFAWNLIFSTFQLEKLTKINPYIMDAMKQLVGVGMGAQPGFSPACDDSTAPIRALQQVFLDIYKVDYAPIIMTSACLNEAHPIYYSPEYFTGTAFSLNNRRLSTKIADLYEIKTLLRKFLHFVKATQVEPQKTLLLERLSTVQYDFFHSHYQDYREVHPVEKIFEDDPSFRVAAHRPDLPLPVNSSFLNGCVRIMKKAM